MNLPQQVLMFMGMLLAALLVEPLAQKLRVPVGVALVVVGFAGVSALTAQGVDTGLRWEFFEPLITYIFIPTIVFQAALELNPRSLWRDLVPILMLAMPVMALAAAIIAAVVYFAIGHPTGFPWMAAWLASVLLASTDPAPTVAMLRAHPAGERVALLLDGESLFNDALAIVLYGTLLPLALMPAVADIPWMQVVGDTTLAFCGGIGIGIAAGGLARMLLRRLQRHVQQGLITLVCAYTCFVLADSLLGWSGVMAVLACGLVLGEWCRREPDGDGAGFVPDLWAFAGYIAGALLFLLSGVTITIAMFREQWLAMLIAIVAVLLSRIVSVMGGLSLLRLGCGRAPITCREQWLVAVGGTRGVVTLALALSLPLELDYWFTVQSMAYGVVLFTLSVQTALLALALRRPARR